MFHFLKILQGKHELFGLKNSYALEFGETDFNFNASIVALSSKPYPKIPFLILFSIYLTLLLQSYVSKSSCL